MAYKIDPDMLAKVAKAVVGTPLEGGELITPRQGLTIHPGCWHIEYGRGAVVTTAFCKPWTRKS
jgi:hypothetical protein